MRTGSQMSSIWEHIELYSRRNLTYDFDALNGIKATLNSFAESTKEPVGNLWGIPFAETIEPLDHDQPSYRAATSSTTGLLSKAIFASHTAVFGYSLAWKLSGDTPLERQSLRRRMNFPTWSWASCTGHVEYPRLQWLIPDQPVMEDPELEVSVATIDGRHVPISEYLVKCYTAEPSHYLHVKAWSVRDALTFDLAKGTALLDLGDADHELSGLLQLDSIPNDDHDNIFKMLSEFQNSQKRWEAFITWLSPSGNDAAIMPFILILIAVEDSQYPSREVYERVGNISSLGLIRIPKQRRRVAPRLKIHQRSRNTMKWAADLMEEQEEEHRKFVRQQKEWAKEVEAKMERRKARRKAREAPDSDRDFHSSDYSDAEECKSKRRVYKLLEKVRKRIDAAKTERTIILDRDQVEADGGTTSASSAPDVVTAGTSATGPVDFAEPETIGTEARKADEIELDGAPLGYESDTGSDDSDSYYTGDYTIDAEIRRGVARRCYPRIPVVRREFIIR